MNLFVFNDCLEWYVKGWLFLGVKNRNYFVGEDRKKGRCFVLREKRIEGLVCFESKRELLDSYLYCF